MIIFDVISIFEFFYLMKFEGNIAVAWGYLLIPLLLLSILLGVVLGFICYLLIEYGQIRIMALPDEDE